MFPCNRPLGFLLSRGGHRVFNVHNEFSTCCTHESETGAEEFCPSVTDREKLKNDPSGCRVQESNPGHWDYSPARLANRHKLPRPPTPTQPLFFLSSSIRLHDPPSRSSRSGVAPTQKCRSPLLKTQRFFCASSQNIAVLHASPTTSGYVVFFSFPSCRFIQLRFPNPLAMKNDTRHEQCGSDSKNCCFVLMSLSHLVLTELDQYRHAPQ